MTACGAFLHYAKYFFLNSRNIPANHVVVDSRIMTINITADPLAGTNTLCMPDPKLLLSYPLTLEYAVQPRYFQCGGYHKKL